MFYRAKLATVWMNEEWYNDRVRAEGDPSWVRVILGPDIPI